MVQKQSCSDRGNSWMLGLDKILDFSVNGVCVVKWGQRVGAQVGYNIGEM